MSNTPKNEPDLTFIENSQKMIYDLAVKASSSGHDFSLNSSFADRRDNFMTNTIQTPMHPMAIGQPTHAIAPTHMSNMSDECLTKLTESITNSIYEKIMPEIKHNFRKFKGGPFFDDFVYPQNGFFIDFRKFFWHYIKDMMKNRVCPHP